MKITRHPDDATLLALAAGTLGEALSAVAAAHVGWCPQCRRHLADMELMGAELLGGLAGAHLALAPREFPARRLESALAEATPAPVTTAGAGLPAPLAMRLGGGLDSIRWRRLAPGVWHHRMALSEGAAGDLRLLKVAPGRRLPDHGHAGGELTLVLQGAFEDTTGRYRRGDVEDVDDQTEHEPVADAKDGCVCLIASEKPLRFKGVVGRLLRPLTGL